MASILKVDDLRGNTAAGNITITSEGGLQLSHFSRGWLNYGCKGKVMQLLQIVLIKQV